MTAPRLGPGLWTARAMGGSIRPQPLPPSYTTTRDTNDAEAGAAEQLSTVQDRPAADRPDSTELPSTPPSAALAESTPRPGGWDVRRAYLTDQIKLFVDDRKALEATALISRADLGAMPAPNRQEALRNSLVVMVCAYCRQHPRADMTPALCVVLATLSDNDHGAAFISIERLSQMLGRKGRAVTAALGRAVRAGWLRKEERRGDTTRYWPVLTPAMVEATVVDLVDALSSKPAARGRPRKTRATRVHPISANQCSHATQVSSPAAKIHAAEPNNPRNPAAPNSDDRKMEGWDHIAALSEVELSALIDTFEEASRIWARSDPHPFDRVGFTKIIATLGQSFRRRSFAAEHIAAGLFEAAQEMLVRAQDSKGGSFEKYSAKTIKTKIEAIHHQSLARHNSGSTFTVRDARSSTTRRQEAPMAGDDSAVQTAVDLFNQAAEQHSFYACVHVTSARRSCIRQRLNDIGGLEKWQLALDAACQDDWLMGRTCREGKEPFKLTIDRLLSTCTGMGDLLASLLDRQDPANQQPRKAAAGDSDARMRPDWWQGREEAARCLPADWWRDVIANYANGVWPERFLGPGPWEAEKCLVPCMDGARVARGI